MARKKKSRKVGLIGVRKPINDRNKGSTRNNIEKKDQKPKNRKGLKPGNRQHLADNDTTKQKSQKTDPRIGSKTPINLAKYKDTTSSQSVSKTVKKRYHSPLEELEAIENNKELEKLLSKQEHKQLTPAEAQFVENLTSRYAELCEMLGIDTEDLENEENDDPFGQLEAIKLEDYKD